MSDPIDTAIDQAHAKASNTVNATVPMLTQAHRWPDEADVTFRAPDDGSNPLFLVWDVEHGAFRPVLVSPGTEWQMKPREAHASERIWKPGDAN